MSPIEKEFKSKSGQCAAMAQDFFDKVIKEIDPGHIITATAPAIMVLKMLFRRAGVEEKDDMFVLQSLWENISIVFLEEPVVKPVVFDNADKN
jgi:hypothetical protein